MRFEAAIEASAVGAGSVPASTAASPSLHGTMADTLGGLIDGIAQLDRMQTSLAAHKAELVDQARQWAELMEAARDDSDRGWNSAVRARRTIVTELACALRIPERTAESLVADSQSLMTDLPATFAALGAGEISWRHARSVIDHGRSVPSESHSAFEEAVLPFAKKLTVAQFDRKARVICERMHPETIEERHERAVEDRFVEMQPDRDGMAWLTVHLPAVVVQGICNRLTDMAAEQQRHEQQHGGARKSVV